MAGACAQPAAPAAASIHQHPSAASACVDAPEPIGTVPASPPAWCLALGTRADTAVRGENRWTDEFTSDSVLAPLAASYRVFDLGRARASTVFKTEHFVHNGHWMVDVAGHGAPIGIYPDSVDDFAIGPNNGGGLMRPDQAFHFVDGRLVVEFDVSAGMAAYGDHAWPEVVVTTAAAPTPFETNGWYAAGVFGGHPVFACGLPWDRRSECRIYDRSSITAHLSAASSAGAARAEGGAPTTAARDSAWRVCGPEQPDAGCRDRFRLVLERDSVSLYVNDVLYMQQAGLPESSRLPDELLTSNVFVYFASWAYLGDPAVVRFHWGRIAINP